MFEELLEKLAIELDKRGVPYMVIGGQAVLAYGEPRLTRDVDLTIGWDSDRVQEIISLVSALGWKTLIDHPSQFAKETMVLPCQDPETGIRIDFIFSFSPYEQTALNRVKKLNIRQTKVNFASVEDLIIHKLVAGRPRDFEDVKNILLKNPQLDNSYILRWLDEFAAVLGKPLVEQFKEFQQTRMPGSNPIYNQ
jgi:predicted nucleotidyltransferase